MCVPAKAHLSDCMVGVHPGTPVTKVHCHERALYFFNLFLVIVTDPPDSEKPDLAFYRCVLT